MPVEIDLLVLPSVRVTLHLQIRYFNVLHSGDIEEVNHGIISHCTNEKGTCLIIVG